MSGIAIKKVGTYTKSDERKRLALKRLIDENGVLHVMKILHTVLTTSDDRHKSLFATKLGEAIAGAEKTDSGWR